MKTTLLTFKIDLCCQRWNKLALVHLAVSRKACLTSELKSNIHVTRMCAKSVWMRGKTGLVAIYHSLMNTTFRWFPKSTKCCNTHTCIKQMTSLQNYNHIDLVWRINLIQCTFIDSIPFQRPQTLFKWIISGYEYFHFKSKYWK